MQVRTPEGRTIAFAYDAFGRRIEKRVARLGRVESVTRYAFRGDVMVHERSERARDGQAPVVEERSYVTLPESVLPLAQRDGAAGALRYFVHGVNGFPEALFEGDGSVATELEAGLYGDVPAEQAGITPLRFPGQYADEETGLHYNWHRYYDPEIGEYLSPEPIGIEGSIKAYAYADGRPSDLVDLDGLRPCVTTIMRRDRTVVTGMSANANALHPAVLAALPPSNARGTGSRVNPEQCAEPAALSAHLSDWEQRNPPRTCRPGDPKWRQNLRAAMNEIEREGGISSHQGDVPRASCPNCSQTIPRLYALAGMMPPTRVIAPGFDNSQGKGPTSSTTMPSAEFNMRANQRPRGDVPGVDNLGTWRLDPRRGWQRHSRT
ncbi:RHS repeat-associated core domain-containing protein [Sorangium sp. So ce302]|uniref:RHS repeat-associated core domain-containing protein n=1 Tax=Sorangium sp. So ce302 TaxID=3133297 RepID=UPI003F61E9E5